MNYDSDSKVDLKKHTKKPLLKAIRKKCIDCCIGQHSEVKICPITDCSLWPYRMGKNPFHQRKMTAEQKQVATQSLKSKDKKS